MKRTISNCVSICMQGPKSRTPNSFELRSRDRSVQLVTYRARQLRCDQTTAEKKLWHYLRAKRLDGFVFRRQFPVDDFIADFCCKERRLVIELDGDQHAERVAYDSWRTQFLERAAIESFDFGIKRLLPILMVCSKQSCLRFVLPLPSPPLAGC